MAAALQLKSQNPPGCFACREVPACMHNVFMHLLQPARSGTDREGHPDLPSKNWLISSTTGRAAAAAACGAPPCPAVAAPGAAAAACRPLACPAVGAPGAATGARPARGPGAAVGACALVPCSAAAARAASVAPTCSWSTAQSGPLKMYLPRPGAEVQAAMPAHHEVATVQVVASAMGAHLKKYLMTVKLATISTLMCALYLVTSIGL